MSAVAKGLDGSIPLGTEVGVNPGHFVLYRGPAPQSDSPQFSAHVCCGQTAGWIKMPLGRKVDLGPGHIVSNGDLGSPKGHSSLTFGPCLLWPNGWTNQDANWYRGRPRPMWHCVRWEPSSPQRGTHSNCGPSLTWPLAKRLDESRCHFWYGCRGRPWPHCVRRGANPPQRGTGTDRPIFGPCLLWPNRGWIKIPLG